MKDHNLKLEIATPSGVFSGIFEKTAKIVDVIKNIIKEQGLAAGDSFELFYQGNALKPETRPLVSFGLEDCASLELVATGSGV